jgi:hypothetical protein
MPAKVREIRDASSRLTNNHDCRAAQDGNSRSPFLIDEYVKMRF